MCLPQVFARGQDEEHRGLTPGFLAGVKHQELVRGRAPRHRGLYLGRVAAVTRQGVRLELAGPVKRGDGVVFDFGDPEAKEEGGKVGRGGGGGGGWQGRPASCQLLAVHPLVGVAKVHVGSLSASAVAVCALLPVCPLPSLCLLLCTVSYMPLARHAGASRHSSSDPASLQIYEVLDARGRPVAVPPGSLGVSRGPVELVFGGKGVGPDLHKVKVRGGRCVCVCVLVGGGCQPVQVLLGCHCCVVVT